jgi:hypothetical protein
MSLGLCDRLQTGGEVFLKAETAASLAGTNELAFWYA